MNKINQEYIKTMREAGCSYNHISRALQIPRTTIASHCYSHGIKPLINIEESDKAPKYYVCQNCGKLFIGKIKRKTHRFCSAKCRNAEWQRKKADEDRLEVEGIRIREEEEALRKELDLLAKESDEWERVHGPTIIGMKRKEVT